MTLKYEILAGYACVHGLPRAGLRSKGVAPGGVFDVESARLTNALVGNAEGTPVLELASASVQIRIASPTALGFVGGGHILLINGREHEPGESLRLEAGSVMEIKPIRSGMRAYLSKSENLLVRPRRLAHCPKSLEMELIRVIGNLPIAEGTVTAYADRIGLRLDADVEGRQSQSELSRPVTAGAIQITPNGQYLIHGPDGPTIGGYDLAGVVAKMDLDKLAQLRPGQAVRFRTVTVEEAREAYKEESKRLERLLSQLRSTAI